MSDQNSEQQQTSPRQITSPKEAIHKNNNELTNLKDMKNMRTRKLLHRSENCVIYEETEEQIKRRLNKDHVRDNYYRT